MTPLNLNKTLISIFFFLWFSIFLPKEEANILLDAQLENASADLATSNAGIGLVHPNGEACYADLRRSTLDSQTPIITSDSGTLDSLIMPGHLNFSIDYSSMSSDSFFLRGERANNFMGTTSFDYTTDYASLVDDHYYNIPAILLKSTPGSITKLTFDFSADEPDHFDFAIWDIDRRDSCKIEIFDTGGMLLDADTFLGQQGGLFDTLAPLNIWNPDSNVVYAPAGDPGMNLYRNYFIFNFDEASISRITITYYAISDIDPDDCELDIPTSDCPDLLFSIYVREIDRSIADAGAGTSPFHTCDSTFMLNGGGSDTTINITTYKWEGPGSFDTTAINPIVSESGKYKLTLTRNDGACEYSDMDSVYVFFHTPDSTYIDLTSCSSSDTGLVLTLLTNQFGCDSTVYTHTALSPSYNNFIQLTSCNPIDTGLVVNNDTTYLGCDSITSIHTALFLSETVDQFESTCDPNLVGSYADTLTSYLGCDSLIQITDVMLNEIPELENDTFFIQEDELPLIANLTINDILPNNVNWIFTINDIGTTGQLIDLGSGSFSYNGAAGIQLFNYEVCNEDCLNLCDTASILIEIESGLCNLPDILTPNGDGFNETLWINCLNDQLLYPNPKLIIINRWQDIVYEAQSYKNGSWHGQNKDGNMLPSGVYYIILELGNGASKILKGPITLIR